MFDFCKQLIRKYLYVSFFSPSRETLLRKSFDQWGSLFGTMTLNNQQQELNLRGICQIIVDF